MRRHITITPIAGAVVVSVEGREFGSSQRALELCEVGYPPVVYVPRADIDMGRLSRTDLATACPWKGWASHFSVKAEGRLLENAAWSYEDPLPEMAEIAGHLAFYPGGVTVTRGERLLRGCG